jgi:extracellular factor (EF) 3-hydroxypalmitic acid methyl ester biosynthesis protein
MVEVCAIQPDGTLQWCRRNASVIQARYGTPSAPDEQGLTLILDRVAEELSSSGRHTVGAMDTLHRALLKSWKRNDVAARESAIEEVRSHSIFAKLLADPMTRRAFVKPRGYPGDADLIDLIYGLEPAVAALNAASPTGRAIYAYNVETIAAQGVRNRRNYIAKVIDEIAERKPKTEVLAVGCGHLRELERCSPTSLRAIARFVGLDHDRRTTSFVTGQSYADFVEPLTASIGVLLRKEIDLGSFDLIYAAGIYDYLQDKLFIALTRRLWEMCRPGGTLLIANLTPQNPQIGYLDACMDWRFVLRNEKRISLLLDAAIGDSHSAQLFREPTKVIAFAKVEKA